MQIDFKMSKINDISNKNAEIYIANIDKHNIDIDVEWFLSQARFPVSSKIIDVGCGSGKLLKKIGEKKQYNRSLIGVEASQKLSNYASLNTKDIPNLEILNSTFENLNVEYLNNWNTDIIIMSFFLHHCEDIDSIFKKAAQIVRSGGKVYIFDRICINDHSKSDFNKYWNNCYKNLHEWEEDIPNIQSINDISHYGEKYGFHLVNYKINPHDTRVGTSLFPKSFIELWKIDTPIFNCLFIPPAFKKIENEIINEVIKNTSINEYDLIKIPYNDDVLKSIYVNLPWGLEFRNFALKNSLNENYTVVIPRGNHSLQILSELRQFKDEFRNRWKSIEGAKNVKTGNTPMILPFHVPEPWEVNELKALIEKYNDNL